MTPLRSSVPGLDAHRFVLCRTSDEVLVLRRVRAIDRIRASLLASRLEHELASGMSPEGSWLRAVRTRRLASRVQRVRLAAAWRHAALAHQRALYSARIGRGGIAVDHDRELVDDLVAVLGSDRPVSARGLAMAWTLLRDGGGPLYRRSDTEQFACTMREIIRRLKDWD